MRELGVEIGKTFGHFTDAAQRIGVYTSADYTDILEDLIEEWKIESITGLNEAGEKARDYVMALPDRLKPRCRPHEGTGTGIQIPLDRRLILNFIKY